MSAGEIISSGVYYFEAKTDNSISRTACTIVRTQGDSLALIVAVESGRLDLVEALLSREDGMNINVQGAKGQTPLIQAAMMGDCPGVCCPIRKSRIGCAYKEQDGSIAYPALIVNPDDGGTTKNFEPIVINNG